MYRQKRQWLIDYRKSKGLTTTKAAELCGMSRRYYGGVELGEYTPMIRNGKRIANALDFDWTKLYD